MTERNPPEVVRVVDISGCAATCLMGIIVISFFWGVVGLLTMPETFGSGGYLVLFGYGLNVLIASIAIAYHCGRDGHKIEDEPKTTEGANEDAERSP